MITPDTIINVIKGMPLADKTKVLNAIQKDVDSERTKLLNTNFILITAPIDEFEECQNIYNYDNQRPFSKF